MHETNLGTSNRLCRNMTDSWSGRRAITTLLYGFVIVATFLRFTHSFRVLPLAVDNNIVLHFSSSSSKTILTTTRLCAKSSSLSQQRRKNNKLLSDARKYLFYSPNFYRHVVYENGGSISAQVVETFSWLDVAREAHPNAVALSYSASVPEDRPVVAGGGVDGDVFYNATTNVSVNNERDGDNLTAVLAVDGLWRCDDKTLQKHDAVVTRLDERLGSSLYSRFPPQDRPWVKERILFLLSPLPPNNDTVTADNRCHDFYTNGHGVGLSKRQTVLAIQALRHLLMIHPLEASSKKPPLSFFYRELRLEFEQLDIVRNELDHWLMGTTTTDAATFVFLRSINVTLDQCEILLQTFSPSLLSFQLKPGWELLSQKGNGLRSELLEDSLHCLRMRLKVTPPLIYNMISTHPRLSSYTFHVLQSHMDELQHILQLSSADVRKVSLRAPSILGLSTTKVNNNVKFLVNEAGLDLAVLRKVVVSDPAILQNSVESNLAPKVDFLKQEGGILTEDWNEMMNHNPSALTVSLNKRIKPTILGFKSMGLTTEDIHSILIRVPDILSYPWETVLLPKISFFQERLGLNNYDLRVLLTKMPRLLLYNIYRSLAPKIRLLEEASCADPSMVSRVILENPSLLLVSKPLLERRIARFRETLDSFEDFFASRESRQDKGVVLRRRSKRVLEFDETMSEALRIFDSVSDAAWAVGTSNVNMYNILKTRRIFKGKYYKYDERHEINQPVDKHPEDLKEETSSGYVHQSNELVVKRVRVSSKSLREYSMAGIVKDHTSLEGMGIDFSDPRVNGTQTCYLAAFVSARTYPWEKSSEVPEKGKAGGTALYFPQFRGPRIQRVLDIVNSYLGLQTIESSKSSFSDGLVMVEYKFPRPSQNRCALFVCFEALRIAARLLSLEATKNEHFVDSKVTIDIFTDSTYAWSVLKNSSDLLHWGSIRNKVEFESNSGAPKVNRDILYPMARIYSTLRNQAIFSSFTKKHGRRFAKEICIRFRHYSELEWSADDPIVRRVADFAQEAAEKQYAQQQKLSRNELTWRDNARYDVFYF